MDTIEIEPGQAIGTIKLGMSRDEVEECIRQYASRYECRKDISFDFSSYFMPEYDSDDRLIALQMTSDVKEHAHNGVIMRDLRSWRKPRTIPNPPPKSPLHPGRRAAKN